MRRTITAATLVTTALLALGACGTDGESSSADRQLTDTTWVVDGLIDGDDEPVDPPQNSTASITISDGTAAVDTGCNRGSSTVEVTDATIVFSPMATTMMACEPELMALETFVTTALTGEVEYTIEAERLTITRTDADGDTIGLTFVAE